ncbi:MAG: hypothetical protein CMO01_15880 [Thalassobius sp.]|nr:hypothetical protein [Thalassovita sp.]
MYAPGIGQLRSMSVEELEELYDNAAQNTVIGTGFILDELRDRRITRVTQRTYMVAVFAAITAFLTLGVSIVALVLALVKATG